MIFQYYVVDWVAMIFTFIAIYLLGNKSRSGFITMMCGNSCWLIVGILTNSLALIIANFVFFVMNCRGYIKWAEK